MEIAKDRKYEIIVFPNQEQGVKAQQILMTKIYNSSIKSYTRFFKVLSDPTRLGIVLLLAKGELCVCQIESALKVHQTKISRHLAYLRKHGIVKARSQWKWKYYSFFKPRDKFERNILNCLQECFSCDAVVKSYFSPKRRCIARTLKRQK